MYKKDYVKLKSIIKKLKEDYNFKGLYHFTDFENLQSIIDEGYLKSRFACKNDNINFLDAANEEVIDHTIRDVKKCVRFYFKEKTPTLYKNEGIKKDNKKPHIPIPIYLFFDYELILLENTIFSSCNAGSSYVKFGKSANFFKNMDWRKIFHRESLPIEDSQIKREIIRKRNAELLGLTDISLEYLNKIIFRSKADYKRAINKFGKNDKFELDSGLFNCNNNYIDDYKININKDKKKKIDIHLKFNRRNYSDYSHRIIIMPLTSGNIIYDKNISFSDGTDLERHGQIGNLPNNKLNFTYYMNDILSIKEII
ncbi:MAG: DarT ssDNA thymidine ADP-ribosyltransferase family protein [Bacillota bacterium]